MADPIITALVSTLQTEVTAGQALPVDIVALSAGLVVQSQTYYNTVQSRRVGLLSGISTAGGEDVSKIAAKYTEVVNADAFQRAQDSADSDLGQIRGGAIGYSTAKLLAVATAVIARATAYQAEFVAVLPS